MFLQPEISIVLAVKDEAELLRCCISDILQQTFTNFELLILDDFSTEQDVQSIVNEFTDERIVFKCFDEHQGLAKIKNAGMDMAKGKYIAMMDADDRYPANKLELQLAFLKSNPNISFCGTNFRILGTKNAWPIFTRHQQIKLQFLLNNPFIHPSVMFKSELISNFRYNPKLDYAEDYDLFFRIASEFIVANFPTVLIDYNRKPKTGLKLELAAKQQEHAKLVREKVLEFFDISLSSDRLESWHRFASMEPGLNLNQILSFRDNISESKFIRDWQVVYCTHALQYCAKHQLRLPIKLRFSWLWKANLSVKQRLKLLFSYD